jgi:hypothetical protein
MPTRITCSAAAAPGRSPAPGDAPLLLLLLTSDSCGLAVRFGVERSTSLTAKRCTDHQNLQQKQGLFPKLDSTLTLLCVCCVDGGRG